MRSPARGPPGKQDHAGRTTTVHRDARGAPEHALCTLGAARQTAAKQLRLPVPAGLRAGSGVTVGRLPIPLKRPGCRPANWTLARAGGGSCGSPASRRRPGSLRRRRSRACGRTPGPEGWGQLPTAPLTARERRPRQLRARLDETPCPREGRCWRASGRAAESARARRRRCGTWWAPRWRAPGGERSLNAAVTASVLARTRGCRRAGRAPGRDRHVGPASGRWGRRGRGSCTCST